MSVLQGESGRAAVSVFLFIILLSLIGGGVYMLDQMELIDARQEFYSLVEEIPYLQEILIPDPVDEIEMRAERLRRLDRRLDEKEARLQQREQTLQDREEEIEQQRQQLQAEEQQLAERERALAERQQRFDDEEARYEYLAELYQGMPPEPAAERIQDIDDDQVILAIFRRMEDRNASIILSNMDPDRVAVLSRKLANHPG